jgi:hypothetical protein
VSAPRNCQTSQTTDPGIDDVSEQAPARPAWRRSQAGFLLAYRAGDHADGRIGKAIDYRAAYRALLGWAFALFNTARVLAYLPTLWAIQAQGASDQHSLLTWLTWTGANVTMALWLYENNGHRLNCAILVNVCNGLMCALIAASIIWHRL